MLHKPKKVTPATVEMLDTPGLLPGTHGDNPQRLALIREGDALLIVLGAFAGGDAAADLAAFRDELLFADLGVVTNRAERLEASVKKPRPDREQQLKELDVVKRVLDALEQGKPIADLGLMDDEKKPMRSFGLLTDNPQILVVNTSQGQELYRLAPGGSHPTTLAIDRQGFELELSQLDGRRTGKRVRSPNLGSPNSAATGSSARLMTPSASSRSLPLATPRCAPAGTIERGRHALGTTPRKQDPHRSRQRLHPRR